MKEQKKEKSFLKNVIFILLLGLFFAGLNSFFQPAWFSWNNYDTFHGFYSEPENTIETIFLGSSAAVNGVDPMELYRRRGLSCYNLGSEQQPLMVSYYWMQEAFRRNPRSLKTVFLDVSELRKGSQPEFYQKGIDPMHFSMVKYNAVKDYTDGKAEDIVSHLVPLFSYHSRWNSLNDLSMLVAYVTSENSVSMRLHESVGFVRSGLISRAGSKFGRDLDLQLYRMSVNK